MNSRVLIVDPLLKGMSGHCYFYDKAVAGHLQGMGITTLVAGHRRAQAACGQIPNFYPCLTDITSSVFAARWDLASWKNVFQAYKDFLRDLKLSFSDSGCLSLRDGDLIFVPTLYIPELLGMAWFFWRRRRALSRVRFSFQLMMRFRYKRRSFFLTQVLTFLYRVSFFLLERSLGNRLIYVTDSELLRNEYESLIRKPVRVFPIPVNPLPVSKGPAVAPGQVDERRNTENGRIMVSYVGGSRYNKGFDVFVNAVEILYTDRQLSKNISFTVQIDVHPQPRGETRIVEEAVRKISSLSRKEDSIYLVQGTVSSQKYYELLAESDVVVLPYRDDAYQSATANILVETVLMGKIPIVSQNTWMAYELTRNGLEGLIFAAGSASDIAEAVRKVSVAYDLYRSRVLDLSLKWGKFHSAGNLVKTMLELSAMNRGG